MKKMLLLSIDHATGEIKLAEISQDMLNWLISMGFCCEIRIQDKKRYFVNTFLYKPEIACETTITALFENLEYCRDSTCSKHADFENIHPDCNVCIKRFAANREELANPPFINEKDNYIQGEPPADIEDDSEECMPYRQYLATEYWKNFRQEVLAHYGEKCNWCGASGEGVVLNVHHVRYGERFEEQIENVIPLCSDCHKKAHGLY